MKYIYKFTYEIESEGKLPVLDLLITRKDTGAVEDVHIESARRDCGYPDWTFR